MYIFMFNMPSQFSHQILIYYFSYLLEPFKPQLYNMSYALSIDIRLAYNTTFDISGGFSMGLFSIFSRSSSKGHHRKHNQGSSYYKRHHSGLLGALVNKLMSRSSHSHHGHHHHNEHHSHRRHKRYSSSWS